MCKFDVLVYVLVLGAGLMCCFFIYWFYVQVQCSGLRVSYAHRSNGFMYL